jgi:hypothetical protein
LEVVLRVLRLVGASEVADQSPPADFAISGRPGPHKGFELGHGQSQTRHAGVDL